MDPNAAPAPGLISSLEAMIQASVTSIIDRRLDPAADTLDAQVQAAVAAAIDKRLSPAVGSLGNRMNSLIEQRLGDAIRTLNHRVNSSVTAALEQRLGPAGSALTAQITFSATPGSTLPSEPPARAHNSGEVIGAKDENESCSAGKEKAIIQSIRNDESIEKAQLPIEQSAAEQASKTCLYLGDGTSSATTTAETCNEHTSQETNANKTGEPKSRDKGPAKRKASGKDEAKEADDTGESESSSSEVENNKGKPKRKRSKVKLDPPGFTNGPSIKFRRVSPKLTVNAKCRGYPRVIDLRTFSEASNKQNLTMADVVATVLFNYDPLSLHAFMENDMYPAFRFIRKGSNGRAKDFVIEKCIESFGVVVKASAVSFDFKKRRINGLRQCGYHLSHVDRAKYRADASRIWDIKYEHIILPIGRWVASNYTQDPAISNSSKRTIEQWATEFGTKILLDKIWEEGGEAKIEADKLELAF